MAHIGKPEKIIKIDPSVLPIKRRPAPESEPLRTAPQPVRSDPAKEPVPV